MIIKIIMDEEELDEFIYEFHERVLGIKPETVVTFQNFRVTFK